jgi:putative endonuclease
MKSGYMYILECADGSYYTGSTMDLKRRIQQHQNFEGSNFTVKKWPVKLVYFEYYDSIALAFHREKQVQGWRRAKKLALIEGRLKDLPTLSNTGFDRRSP